MPDLDADTDEARSRGTSSRAREAMTMLVDVCVFILFVFALFVMFVERSCYAVIMICFCFLQVGDGECQDTPKTLILHMSISDTKCDQNVFSPKGIVRWIR